MKQSKLFGKTLKHVSSEETSANAKFLLMGGFIDKLTAGVYTFLPLGLRVLNNIENIIRNEINKLGGQEVLMPSLHPKETWMKTGRWDVVDVLFKFTSFYSKIEYALGPTHEEVVTPLAGRTQLSYKDLPFGLYQFQTKFRDEKRAKSGIMRGREFRMKDLYSFHASQEDLDNYYANVQATYNEIYKKLGIGDITLETYASGGDFSKYSHEYQTISDIGEDTIYVCEKCNIGINKEIITDQNSCPKCNNDKLVEKPAVEVGNIFKLGTRFSEAFDLKYTDKEGKQNLVIMGCYGIGPSRIMGTLVEIFHDDKGIIWPVSVSPYDIHLISIGVGDEVMKKSQELYDQWTKEGKEVLWDDRDTRAGEKFADSDLIGIPKRIIISDKTLAQDSYEEVERATGKATLVKF